VTRERIFFWTTAAAAAVLRALAFFRYRFDADEQHHAHVAWGWTAGMVQYRDYFDNHAPLFHLLMAPWLAMFGERSDILLWMRLPMLALFAVVLWATYDIAKRVFDARIAAWSVLLLALFPPFFLKSLELRTDNLWVAFWMLALVGIVRRWPAFVIGLLLGCAFATSMKTTLLLISLAVAGGLTWFFRVRSREAPPRPGPLPQRGRGDWGLALLGFVLVPGVLAFFFVSAGAWDALLYCNFTFNGNLARTRDNLWFARALFPFTFGALVWAAWRKRDAANAWAYFFALVIGVYTVTLFGFWILISPRDFLPLMPLGAMFLAAFLARHSLPATATVVALSIASLWYYADRFENRTAWHTTMLDQALRLTRPGELVIDLKGELIYRHRPFYYAFELITRSQIARGIIEDTVAREVVRKRTYVAQADGPMWPPAARAWLSDHFVNLGRLRAAGQWVKPDGSFTIGVPGPYIVLDANGVAVGTLDGTPHRGPRELAAGAHRWEGAEGVCVVWAPAFQRGHSPFHLRDLKF